MTSRLRPVFSSIFGTRPTARLGPALLLLTLLSVVSVARAQFSGPTPAASRATNLPVRLTTDPAILYPAVREIELSAGDQVSVHLFDASDYSPTLRISLDGSIQLPLIGVVHIAGLTLHQAEDLIARRLTDAGMYRNPQVSIQLLDSPGQIITVAGEVHGVVPVPAGGNKRLYDVLGAVGGLPATASHLITINRPGVAEPITVDLGPDPLRSAQANIPVFAHDTVVTARIGVVYVLGAFRQQGAVPLQQNTPLTLMQAAALGQGYGYEGKLNDLRIVRTVGLERKLIKVDLGKIMKGKEPDPVLQADDIVFLPTDQIKAAIKVGGINTVFGILSTIIFAVR